LFFLLVVIASAASARCASAACAWKFFDGSNPGKLIADLSADRDWEG